MKCKFKNCLPIAIVSTFTIAHISLAYGSEYNNDRTKLSRQIEEGAYNALIKANLIKEADDGNDSSTKNPNFSTLPEALGFCDNDIQVGGSVKTRLENIITNITLNSSSCKYLISQVNEYGIEHRKDMNILIDALNNQQNRIYNLEKLVLTMGIMIQEIIDPNNYTQDEMISLIKDRQKNISIDPSLKSIEKPYSEEQLQKQEPLHFCCNMEKNNNITQDENITQENNE